MTRIPVYSALETLLLIIEISEKRKPSPINQIPWRHPLITLPSMVELKTELLRA